MDKIAVMLALIMMLAHAGVIYPQTMVIDTVERVGEYEYNVTMRTSTGIAYTYTAEDGDIEPGDVMSAIMYNNSTPDDVTDDDILTMRYTGFYQRPASAPAETDTY